jgi:subtilisin family serine protease
VAAGLLVTAAPAWAGDDPAPAPAQPSIDLGPLPVEAIDVTRSDTSLRSTVAEVTVLVQDGDDPPTVSKLRADSPAEAVELAEHLDDQPGVVAARTTRLRALGVNGEPMAPDQWNLQLVGAPDAWDVTQGAGVTVAVVDTGLDVSHPDLDGRVLPEIDLLPDVTPLPEQNAHGTRVASLIAGALNGVGMAGVAPQASILPVAALDPSGVGDSSTVAAAIIAAADAGARVINLSLGGPDRDPVLDQACAYAYSKGAVLVAAAGNSFQFGNEVQYPAASPDVVAVASVDATGTPSAFSNTGPHIDIAAPGQDVLAAVPFASYDRENGTSFATPHVAAAAALVAAANPALSAAQIISAVTLTAQDDVSGNGRDDQLGYGIVRADRAVAAALSMQASDLPAGARLRLRGLDALPEPGHRGQVTTVRVVVQARYPDRSWRPDPLPALVRFEFKPTGSRKFRQQGVVASGPDGVAVLQVPSTRSGIWRAKVRQPTGKWSASNIDRLRVRR